MPKIVDYEARREELGTALLEVLAREGIDRVSVRSVAAQAGWTRGVIQHYFTDRDELLLYAYRLALQREAAADAAADTGDALDELVRTLLRALPTDEMSSLDFRIFLGLLGRLADKPELATSLSADHAAYEAKIVARVEAAVEAGAIRSALPPETIARLLAVFVDGLGVTCALYADRSDRAYLESQIRQFIGAL
ncbi:TetR family transcriptional regulator C-terminal domain-containing protein [Nocardioides sp. NPDC023903]|uniref:TetR/AcrR family transcriptional regulator n=1 Tax=Nocardioides sp. NPDC023903 TaxID=3157195 RepID=UPI0033EF48BD